MEREHPGFFRELVGQQAPQFLWIGCSDSRVPANEIVGLMPGEVFVHRNIANVVADGDRNCLSVIQYAVAELRVKHIMVVGHYGCGGVRAATQSRLPEPIEGWIAPIRSLHHRNRRFFDACASESDRWAKLCELNVIEQARNVSQTDIVQGAWQRGQELAVHGWIYALSDGQLRDLEVTVSDAEEASAVFPRRAAEVVT